MHPSIVSFTGVTVSKEQDTVVSVQGSPLRSYQMPVRDEESESQRKARSRLMRQSRRSTQVWAWAGACALGSEGGGLGQSLP